MRQGPPRRRTNMRYLCLGFHEDAKWAGYSDSERDALMEETSAYIDLLRAGGHVIDQQALQGVNTATTLRFEKGKASVTDGPFAETKEQLGGVILLEAMDLNHAIQLMSRMPCMRLGGSIEIRPVNEQLTEMLKGESHEVHAADLHG